VKEPQKVHDESEEPSPALKPKRAVTPESSEEEEIVQKPVKKIKSKAVSKKKASKKKSVDV